MKIRTITIGLPGIPTAKQIHATGQQLERAVSHFESSGYEVQSRRISLPHWDQALGRVPECERESLLKEIDEACIEAQIDFCSMGVARIPDHIDQMTHVLAQAVRLAGSAEIASPERGLNRAGIQRSAEGIIELAARTLGGFGNFRFGAACCVRPGTPFFPASYHDGTNTSFSIGLENSDVLVQACESAQNLAHLRGTLDHTLEQHFGRIVEVAKAFAQDTGLSFLGLDTSIAPSLQPGESIVKGFEALGTIFGEVGTLAICSEITRAVQAVNVARVGYCGLMLPVLEDIGLAAATISGAISVTHLLAYSAVCGVGIDMVAIPGDVRAEKVAALLLDTATLSLRLTKPLSVRLLPALGKTAGEVSAFASPFVCNAAVLPL